MARERSTELIGVGIYGIVDAARLLRPTSTKASAHNIQRWLDGHEYRCRGEPCRAKPLWKPQHPRMDGRIAIGFRDLMELRFVASFREAGLSLQAIRLALKRARDVVGHAHPFATERFRTDGSAMFLELASESGEPSLLDLLQGQYAIHRMLEPSFKDIDFEAGLAARWWPLSEREGIVLDPTRCFGKPIDHGSGVPADTLGAAVEPIDHGSGVPADTLGAAVDVFGSEEEVAHRFEVDVGAVRAAQTFTQSFAA